MAQLGGLLREEIKSKCESHEGDGPMRAASFVAVSAKRHPGHAIGRATMNPPVGLNRVIITVSFCTDAARRRPKPVIAGSAEDPLRDNEGRFVS
jgi:hypothetical protein